MSDPQSDGERDGGLREVPFCGDRNDRSSSLLPRIIDLAGWYAALILSRGGVDKAESWNVFDWLKLELQISAP